MNNSYRIKANVGKDQVLKVNLKQDVDLYEILSLKLDVSKGSNEGKDSLYKLHYSDYGVIVGRVLANDAFGVPNVKVSVFIDLSKEDSLRGDIKSIYPYKFVTDVNNRNVKYNTLPNYKKNDCHQAVGSFPKKTLVLDDDSILEVYDKYYKYTTITNNSGDYMIFGVPTGQQILHVDVDLSDIGILSQKPRDFIYKGYSPDMFESPTQFKTGTNLDNLAQIHNENASVTVYPFWGDKTTSEIAITRKDINLQYKFESTCVFLGSVITDTNPNSISHNCIPDPNMGDASQLTPSEGTIEMIRQTTDGTIEEYSIKGNQLINGDGIWCYQIPMNLDYVGMDEYGNIVPTDNPNKGIATRARVRFRITLNESGSDSFTTHKARFLIPNNPDLYQGYVAPYVNTKILDEDSYYEFGTLTPDECFRDLYWNKVYSVKAYIPRLQASTHESVINYLALKGVNKKGARKNNPLPFNKMNLNMTIPAYTVLHKAVQEQESSGSIGSMWRFLRHNAVRYSSDAIREQVADEMDAIGLDFYNDWLNGCLYFPAWFWHIIEKKKYKKGESVYESSFCECKNVNNSGQNKLYLFNNCSLIYNSDTFTTFTDRPEYKAYNYMYTAIALGSKKTTTGIIKKKVNKDGAEVFYYTFGDKVDGENPKGGDEQYDESIPEKYRDPEGQQYYRYVRLFSTDIILLGSLNECDINSIPTVGFNLPATTSNIPYIGRYKHDTDYTDSFANGYPEYEKDDEKNEEDLVTYNGMNWGKYWQDENHKGGDAKPYFYRYGSGLLFGLYLSSVGLISWLTRLILGYEKPEVHFWLLPRLVFLAQTQEKSCINAERLCELGVSLDSTYEYTKADSLGHANTVHIEMDGLITKRELEDVDSRALFASLNSNKLNGVIDNDTTGYKDYRLTFCYPTNFDGRLEHVAEEYTSGDTTDDRNHDYISFRLGSTNGLNVKYVDENGYEYSGGRPGGGHVGHRRARGTTIHGDGFNSNSGRATKTYYYVNDNGEVSYSEYEAPRNAHFYGFTRGAEYDAVYPFQQKYINGGNNKYIQESYDYVFPLYENSFYFYFGINQGRTAIDKFYKEFYSPCKVDSKDPFKVKLDFEAAKACNSNSGSIKITTDNITMPYTVQVVDSNNVATTITNIEKYETTVAGLSNGKYTVIVEDYYGNTMEQEVTLMFQPVSLNADTIRNISEKYTGQTLCDNQDACGLIEISSCNLYGQLYPIQGFTPITPGTYKLTGITGYDVRFTVTSRNGGEIGYYLCQPSGNRLVVGVPGVYDIEVYEMCNGEKTENVSHTTAVVSDTDGIELYINEVPFTAIAGARLRRRGTRSANGYNSLFYDEQRVNDVSATSISGWFGVNDPNNYADVFNNGLSDENRAFWKGELGDDVTALDVVETKMRWVFNLADGAYVTAGEDSTFNYEVTGGNGIPLLRSASPIYEDFSETNTEHANEFDSYITSERNSVTCSEYSPNIVSENYTYVDDSTSHPDYTANITDYDFNPKYSYDDTNSGETVADKAGNYAAGFSNYAYFTSSMEGLCMKSGPSEESFYKKLPVESHDLYKDYVLCPDGEYEGILPVVYKSDETKRYFRTEFIDRRFDYDFVFITPCEVGDYEQPQPPVVECDCTGLVISRIQNRGTRSVKNVRAAESWYKLGRISAITYNGIEMLYDNDKKILSKTGNTEYNYDDNAVLTLNNTSAKRFYESTFKCGNNINIDLRDSYVYNQRATATANYVNDYGDRISLTPITPGVTLDNKFENISTNEGDVKGYPSKRVLNLYGIPASNSYKFSNTSCNYKGLSIGTSNGELTASAIPGETTEFDIEAGNMITLVTDAFERYYAFDKYDIKFTGRTTYTASHIYPFGFKIATRPIANFDTKTEKIAFYVDDESHSGINTLKTGNTDVDTYFSRNAVTPPTVLSDVSDTFQNYVFEAPDVNISGSYISILHDRHYYSTYRDSLMKNVRVINTATMFDVSKFIFTLSSREVLSATVSNVSARTENNITTNVSTTGSSTVNTSVTGSGTGTTSSGESVTVSITGSGSGNVTVNSTGTGSGRNNITVSGGTGTKKYDSTTFRIGSEFISDNLEDICFKITFGGITANYALSSGAVKSTKTNDEILLTVNWLNHITLLDDGGTANVKTFMKISNGLVYGFEFNMTKNGIS